MMAGPCGAPVGIGRPREKFDRTSSIEPAQFIPPHPLERLAGSAPGLHPANRRVEAQNRKNELRVIVRLSAHADDADTPAVRQATRAVTATRFIPPR
jgi:hypothetical protein